MLHRYSFCCQPPLLVTNIFRWYCYPFQKDLSPLVKPLAPADNDKGNQIPYVHVHFLTFPISYYPVYVLLQCTKFCLPINLPCGNFLCFTALYVHSVRNFCCLPEPGLWQQVMESSSEALFTRFSDFTVLFLLQCVCGIFSTIYESFRYYLLSSLLYKRAKSGDYLNSGISVIQCSYWIR